MNILIVQQLAWGMRIGHDVARTFHNQKHHLSALVHGLRTKEFIEEQTEIPYQHVYFADPLYDKGHAAITDDNIREIEERYSLESIWKIIYADRYLVFSFLNSRHFLYRKPVSNNYILSVCWHKYQLVRDMIEQVRPDFVLAPVIGCLINYLLYLECKHRNIPFYTIGASRFGSYFFIADDQYLRNSKLRERFEILKTCPEISPKYEEAKDLYSSIRKDDSDLKPSYLKIAQSFSQQPARISIKALGSLCLFPLKAVKAVMKKQRVMAIDNIWMPANSRRNNLWNTYMKLREQFIPTDEQRNCLKSTDHIRFRYIFFPLHFEPELSLLVYSPEYANQIEVCRRVAMSLSQGVRLLVKEHPSMVKRRQKKFYDDLKGLLNVELIHSSIPSHEIFMNKLCQGALVISSTVGFEAAINSCPVISLAPADFNVLPTAHHAKSINDAIEHIRKLCTRSSTFDKENIDRDNLAYLCAMIENSFASDYMEKWTMGKAAIDVDKIVLYVLNRLNEHKEKQLVQQTKQ